MIVVDEVVVAVEVGEGGTSSWWRASPAGEHGGRDLEALADVLVSDLRGKRRIALGFTGPMFVPMPHDARRLARPRSGEDNASWCVGRSAEALAQTVQQVGWLVRRVRSRIPRRTVVATTVMAELLERRADLAVWEAMGAPGDCDARRAVEAFTARCSGRPALDDLLDPTVLSLAGLALVWGGFTVDPAVLAEPCLVVRVPSAAGIPVRA